MRHDPKYTQGYWVELQKKRYAGGVSAELEGWEVGAGALYTEELFGFTGYLQYGIPFLQGRVQVDFTTDKRWQPYFAVGMPLPIESVKLEPHITWPFDDFKQLKFGLRVQYQF